MSLVLLQTQYGPYGSEVYQIQTAVENTSGILSRLKF